MQTKKQKISQILGVVAIGTVLGLSLQFVRAWSEPNAAAPTGNVAAPLNVGTTTQIKSGALGINGAFRVGSTAIFDGNVGVGTISPTQKVDVNGYVKGTGLCIGNDCRTTWPAASEGGITVKIGGAYAMLDDGAQASCTFNFDSTRTGGTASARIYNGILQARVIGHSDNTVTDPQYCDSGWINGETATCKTDEYGAITVFTAKAFAGGVTGNDKACMSFWQ